MLDRIDIHIEVQAVKYEKFQFNEKEETSEVIRNRVNRAREIQVNRYRGLNIMSNSQLSPNLINKYCSLDEKGNDILKKAFDRLGLTARAYSKILKLARTIADIDGEENILANHIAEAIQYRDLDRKYWKGKSK